MSGRPISRPTQPLDEWDFVPDDDDLAPDRPLAAEDAAVHIEGRGEPTPAADPGRSDVLVGDEDTTPGIMYFEDEEPDAGADPVADREDDHEPDLEELLESQHYAFPSADQAR